jgi:leader peptidase (prepilin peptidase)/N-methyltransferase
LSALGLAAYGVGGLAVGVALHVVIERVPARRSLLAPPFPEIGSGLRRPAGLLVAVATGALFVGLAARIGDSWELPAYLVLAAALVALSVIDLRHYMLPNRIVAPLAGVTVV